MRKSIVYSLASTLFAIIFNPGVSVSQVFKSPASFAGDTVYKTTMTPILSGKLGRKFHHGWVGMGGDNGRVDRSTGILFNKVRIPYNLPKGTWLLDLNALLSHTNGGFRIWIETDGGTGLSESTFMNPYNTGNTWESTSISNSFSGVIVKTDQPIYIVLLHTCAPDAGVSNLGSIFLNFTAIQIKKSYD